MSSVDSGFILILDLMVLAVIDYFYVFIHFKWKSVTLPLMFWCIMYRKDSSVPILSDIVTEIIKNKEAEKTAKPCVENNAQDLDNKDKLGCATDVPETRRESVDKGSENNHMKGPLSGHSRRKSQRAAVDASASRKTKTAADFFNISVPSEGREKKNTSMRSDYQNNNTPSPQVDATETSADFFKIPVSSERREKKNKRMRSDHQNKNIPSPQLDATNDPENVVSSKVRLIYLLRQSFTSILKQAPCIHVFFMLCVFCVHIF